MKKFLAMIGIAAVCAAGMSTAWAEPAKPMPKEQCLACHGPAFEDLIKKNVQVKTDSGMVNPHQWIPHAGGPDKQAIECTQCHAQHPMPPKAGYKDANASLDPCYSCHHNYEFKPCSSCHK